MAKFDGIYIDVRWVNWVDGCSVGVRIDWVRFYIKLKMKWFANGLRGEWDKGAEKAESHLVKVLIYIFFLNRKEGKLENFPIHHSHNTQLWISIAILISVGNIVNSNANNTCSWI